MAYPLVEIVEHVRPGAQAYAVGAVVPRRLDVHVGHYGTAVSCIDDEMPAGEHLGRGQGWRSPDALYGREGADGDVARQNAIFPGAGVRHASGQYGDTTENGGYENDCEELHHKTIDDREYSHYVSYGRVRGYMEIGFWRLVGIRPFTKSAV